METFLNFLGAVIFEFTYAAYPLIATGIMAGCLWIMAKTRRRLNVQVFAFATPAMFLLLLVVGHMIYFGS